MREIKFRAWDKKTNKWLDLNDFMITFGNNGIVHVYDTYCNETESVNCDIKLLQYIGIKDQNGNEIYEGDILKSDLYGQTIAEVIYHKCSFGIVRENVFYPLPLHDPWGNPFKTEVVGNRYETSNL